MNRRTRKRSRQKGGKLVGHGSYGCGFFPGFRCAADTRRVKQFSKLMYHNDAVQEYKEVQHIRKVDPKMKYSVYPSVICNIHPDDFEIANEEGLFDCIITEKMTTEQKKEIYDNISKRGLVKLLQAPYGGEELHNIKNNIVYSNSDQKQNIIKILKELVNVFDALVLYQSKNLVHLDIKSDNVVCKDTCKYIDFGISNIVNNIIKPESVIYKKLHIWAKKQYLYRYRPFDIMFIFDDIWTALQKTDSLKTNGSHRGKTLQEQEQGHSKNTNNRFFKDEVDTYFNIISNTNTEVPLEVINGKYIKTEKTSIIQIIDSYTTIRNIINRFIKENKAANANMALSKSLKKFILLQSDVYSLGLMLVSQVRDIFQVQMYYGNLYKFGPEATEKSPVTNTIIDYQIVIDLFELCKQMIHLDPFIRLNANEAAAQYKSIIKRLD